MGSLSAATASVAQHVEAGRHHADGLGKGWEGRKQKGENAAGRLLHPLPAGLGEACRVQAAGNDEPISFSRVGDANRIGLDCAQIAQGLPSLRLAADRVIEFAHDANCRLFERANFLRAWSASSALP
jgi:hypothetical protein